MCYSLPKCHSYQSGVGDCQRLGNAPLPAIKHKSRHAKEQVPVPKLQFTTSGSFILYVLYVCDLFCFLACYLLRHMDREAYHVYFCYNSLSYQITSYHIIIIEL